MARAGLESAAGVSLTEATVTLSTTGESTRAVFDVTSGSAPGRYQASLDGVTWLAWTFHNSMQHRTGEPTLSPVECRERVQAIFERSVGAQSNDLTWSHDPRWSEWGDPVTVEARGELSLADGQRTSVRLSARVMPDGTVVGYRHMLDPIHPIPEDALSREDAIAAAMGAATDMSSPSLVEEPKLTQFRGEFTWFVRLGEQGDTAEGPYAEAPDTHLFEIDAITGRVRSAQGTALEQWGGADSVASGASKARRPQRLPAWALVMLVVAVILPLARLVVRRLRRR